MRRAKNRGAAAPRAAAVRARPRATAEAVVAIPDLHAELTEAATSTGPPDERARRLLAGVRRVVPFDSGWLTLTDPLHNTYSTVASSDLDDSTAAFLESPVAAREIDLVGANRDRPPMSVADLPFDVEDLQTWAQCLLPAGYREGLWVSLYARDGRRVGFLAALSASREPPPLAVRQRLGRLTRILADGIDPMRSLLTTSQLVSAAAAGVVLRSDGEVQPVPGLPDHALLAPGGAVLELAAEHMGAGRVYTTFLWPVVGGGPGVGPRGDDHLRVSVLAATADAPRVLRGLVLLSLPHGLRGLTPRELQVLGLLTDGRANADIARVLHVTPRTVAAHLEHILVKLGAPTRTMAAVLAEREGLYVPSRVTQAREEHHPETGTRARTR